MELRERDVNWIISEKTRTTGILVLCCYTWPVIFFFSISFCTVNLYLMSDETKNKRTWFKIINFHFCTIFRPHSHIYRDCCRWEIIIKFPKILGRKKGRVNRELAVELKRVTNWDEKFNYNEIEECSFLLEWNFSCHSIRFNLLFLYFNSEGQPSRREQKKSEQINANVLTQSVVPQLIFETIFIFFYFSPIDLE